MSTTIDQQFVEYIVKSLVGNPDAVKVERRIDEKGVLLELTVDNDDLGRVIGKRGATAQSLRTLLRALGTKNDARYNLKIVDPSGGFGRDNSSQNSSHAEDAPVSNATAQPAPAKPYNDSDDEDTGLEKALEEKSEEESDVVSKTRKELEDLDDLDV